MRNGVVPREPAIIVLAKSPVAGRVKTRCTPPCTPEQGAELAAAAMIDTLEAVLCSSARRVVIALDGEPCGWFHPRFEIHGQCAGSLGDRIDHAFRVVGQPAILIGMDTPQVTADILDQALYMLRTRTADAVVGPSADGGFWALGVRNPEADVCHDVPMSRDDTCAHLYAGLRRRRLTSAVLPLLVDVDDFATAVVVADEIPTSNFARTVGQIASELDLFGWRST
jgi:glycosyltransferase A (GT-A) superfamily protein (DUF2064 family)